MTVLCPTQRRAYETKDQAISASKTIRMWSGAHLCPTCGFWHAGARYQFCARTKKIPYCSQEEAQDAANRTNAEPDGWGTNYPYECDACGQWHIGRPHKGKSLQ